MNDEIETLLRTYSLESLKGFCRRSNLPVTGNKTELAERYLRKQFDATPTEKQVLFMEALAKKYDLHMDATAMSSRHQASEWIDRVKREHANDR